MKNADGRERKRKPLSDLTISNLLPSSSSSFSIDARRGTVVGLDVSEPISAFCTRIHTLNEKKRNAKKAIANSKISKIRDKSDEVELEGLGLPKARILTVSCKKKKRAVSYEEDVSKDAQLQDYIEKQNAYFKEVDQFELPEEEVESVHELD
ncbi:uncharacterized protein LOC124823372 [Vigna umbellata]|uniref:uncharacterized protein LOC124823372 n=1 Tax=Vigna umbellata TaxID=87088 RepID=UPI001F5EC11E|nr:uncharacterized protein LOC124823372 [Vigna umbellata]